MPLDSCHSKFCTKQQHGKRRIERIEKKNASELGFGKPRVPSEHPTRGGCAVWPSYIISNNRQQQIQLDHGIRHRHRIAIKQALSPSGKKDCPNNFLYSCCCAVHTFKQRRSQQHHHDDTTTRHGHWHTRRSGTWLAQEISRRPRRATSPRTMAFSQCR